MIDEGKVLKGKRVLGKKIKKRFDEEYVLRMYIRYICTYLPVCTDNFQVTSYNSQQQLHSYLIHVNPAFLGQWGIRLP